MTEKEFKLILESTTKCARMDTLDLFVFTLTKLLTDEIQINETDSRKLNGREIFEQLLKIFEEIAKRERDKLK